METPAELSAQRSSRENAMGILAHTNFLLGFFQIEKGRFSFYELS